jgi:hypothetical protein
VTCAVHQAAASLRRRSVGTNRDQPQGGGVRGSGPRGAWPTGPVSEIAPDALSPYLKSDGQRLALRPTHANPGICQMLPTFSVPRPDA